MRQKRALFLLLGTIAFVAAFWSLLSLNVSAHKTLDQRVYEVGSQLKCPVCQSESVADSPALIAQQMRGVIRQQLKAGRSEQQVTQYFIHTYGEQIAWSPPWQGFTLLAWLVPIVLVLAGAVLLLLTLREWRTIAPARVDEDEKVLADLDEPELERYRIQLEQELADDDSLFRRSGREGH
ncbi:MAG: cytochrome c-type biogenesis protein CcmH [Ktedonobacteraceae bacterium]|nr:cytochrome c-type biogenesis protein CcmH [Ktedonobacteraceae bacterium]